MSIYKLIYNFLLIIEITLDINNFLVFKIISNLVNIVTKYFFSIISLYLIIFL